jgi:hypothetical protein
MSITPTLRQRQAIDAFNLWCRAKEEELMCRSDMLNMIAFLKREHDINSKAIALHRLSNSSLSKGAVHLLVQKLMLLELELAACENMFSGYCECDSTGFSNFVYLLNGHKLSNHVQLELGVVSDDTACDGLVDEDQYDFSEFEDVNKNVDENNYSDFSSESDEEYDEPMA